MSLLKSKWESQENNFQRVSEREGLKTMKIGEEINLLFSIPLGIVLEDQVLNPEQDSWSP